MTRTDEEKDAIQAEVESKIEDGTLRLAFVGAATAEAIGELLIKKGIITGAELSEAFLDSLEKNIKHYKE